MPIKIKIYNKKAEEAGSLELSDKVFGVKMNSGLVHQAFVAQTANERQVLAHTKDRSEVRGGGKKPWRQKGTGRARAGSSRSPIWIGGGVTFGPRKDRNFKKDINQKMKRKAMAMVLSDKLSNNNFLVIDKMEIDKFKTKEFNAMLALWEKTINSGKKEVVKKRSTLVINNVKDEKVKTSGRNLVGVTMLNLENINISDLLKHRYIIMTKAGVEKLNKRYEETKKAI